MKKILIAIITLFLVVGVVGCNNNTADTPTKRVESFLGKYQENHQDVLNQLDDVIDTAGTMTMDHKNDYRSLMQRQYKGLTYKIIDETREGNSATVEVEIEVYDYATSIRESEAYLISNKDEFMKNRVEGEDMFEEVDNDKFMTHKINQLKDVTNRVKHTVIFTLTKDGDTWKINDISDTDRQKIHGLY